MPVPLSVLVTGATGKQGAATGLALQGVTLHVGDFADLATLQRALDHNIIAIFLNVSPSSIPNREVSHARNLLLAAASTPSITHIIYPSITLCGQHATFPDWPSHAPDSFMSNYWLSKHAIETLVRASPAPHTTILRPPTFMSNYIAPSLPFFFPELASRHTLRTALAPTTRTLISPEDIGACAAAAFLDPATYSGRTINIGGEATTLDEMVAALGRVSGKGLRAEQMGEEEVRRAVEGGNMQIASQLFFNERSSAEVNLEAVGRDFPGVNLNGSMSTCGQGRRSSRLVLSERVARRGGMGELGVIQGAMVLRDNLYTSMTVQDYHTTIASKVQGTWNLHNVALAQPAPLRFFTLLSSISGVVGQKGQANYAAANVFLDNFALYRHKLGLVANSVDLGAIEDVGYMSEHSDLVIALDRAAWTPINESLFHKIVRFSLFQQQMGVRPAFINESSRSQLITSIAVPQKDSSSLLADARFGPLCINTGKGGGGSEDRRHDSAGKAIQAFLVMLKSGTAEKTAVLSACVDVLNQQFSQSLRLSEPMEPAKSLASYGLDSLAAVEFRNWVRMELGAEVSTLDITNASSLISLGEKIVGKIAAA